MAVRSRGDASRRGSTTRARLSAERVNLTGRHTRRRILPWPVAAVGGAVGVAVSCWVVLAAIAVIGWFQLSDVSLIEPLRLGAQFWLLAQGGGIEIESSPVTIVPLGITLGCVIVAIWVAQLAGKQARVDEPDEISWPRRRALAWRVGGSFGAAYLACVLAAAAAFGPSDTVGRALLGGAAIGFGSGLLGASRALGVRMFRWLPRSLSAVPAAIWVGTAVMTAFSVAVVIAGLAMRWDQVMALSRSLNPGQPGGVLLALTQLAWWPNYVLWCGSWALGAGFQIGAETIVTPAITQVGLLPALPVFGALPASGMPPASTLWWLLSGVAAGAAAAAMVVMSRRRARFDETSLVGGLAGVGVGLVWTVLAALSGGALGTDRLAVVGARLAELAVMAPVVMGLSGLITGLALGLARRPVSSERPAGIDWSEPLQLDD